MEGVKLESKLDRIERPMWMERLPLPTWLESKLDRIERQGAEETRST